MDGLKKRKCLEEIRLDRGIVHRTNSGALVVADVGSSKIATDILANMIVVVHVHATEVRYCPFHRAATASRAWWCSRGRAPPDKGVGRVEQMLIP